MRLIFIPGLGEDELIFKEILPLIEGDKLVLNSWTIAGDKPRGKTNALQMAKEVIKRYGIRPDDIIIGHSMGGLIALYIKYLIGCKIIQIASFTHHNRVIIPVNNYNIIKYGVKSHIFFNKLVRWLLVKLQYNNKPSKKSLTYAFDLLKEGNKNNVINQITVALTPVIIKGTVQPDLRIHSKGDLIIRPPKEDYVEVPGDHFALFTHAKEVAGPINRFIAKARASAV